MKIVDKRRFNASVAVFLILIALLAAIGTIEVRTQQQIKAMQIQWGGEGL